MLKAYTCCAVYTQQHLQPIRIGCRCPSTTSQLCCARHLTCLYTHVLQVARVHYPGLPSHPHHKRVKGVFSGYGGMLAVELKGGVVAAEAMLKVRITASAAATAGSALFARLLLLLQRGAYGATKAVPCAC